MQARAKETRVDDFVDEAEFGGLVWVRELLAVVGDEECLGRDRVFGLGDLSSSNDVDGPVRTWRPQSLR